MYIFKMFILIGLIGVEVMGPLEALGKEPQDIIFASSLLFFLTKLTIRKINVMTAIQPFLQRR